MTLVDGLKFLHVLAAVLWVGGGVMLQLLMYRARKLGPESVSAFSQGASWTSNVFFMPASFAALIFGIWLVIAGGYDWGDAWISIGLSGYLASAVIGMAFLGPTSKKMAALAEERGPSDPVVTQLARRIDNLGRIDLLILVFVTWAMVVKPGL